MSRFEQNIKKALELLSPWLVLAILLAYSYADIFQHPFGLTWNQGDGMVTNVFVNEREPTVHVGDRLVRVGSTDFQAYQNDLRKGLFDGVKPGDLVPVAVRRGEQLITVEWRLPGANPGEIKVDAWLAGDTVELHTLFNSNFTERYPQLYQVLIVQRNRAFAHKIEALLKGDGVVFVAVGQGHLVGPDSVQADLAADGIQTVRQ